MIPAIISAAGGLIGAGIQASVVNKTNKKNLQLQEEINRRNIKLQKEMNAYNSPVAQMSRYTAAGINPLAAYADVSSGTQESLPSQVAPTYEAPNLSNLSDVANNALTYELQSSQNEARIKLMTAQTGLYIAKEGTEIQKFEQTAALFDLRKEELQQSVNLLDAKVTNTMAELYNIVAEGQNIDAATAYLQEQKTALLKQYDLWDKQIQDYQSQIDLRDKQGKLFDAQTLNWFYRNQVDAEQAKYLVAYFGAKQGIAANEVSIDLLSRSISLLSDTEQMKLLEAASYYATINKQYAPDNAFWSSQLLKWTSEDKRAVAGVNWDEWQQGQARKNWQTYGLGTLDSVSSAAATGYFLFSGNPAPTVIKGFANMGR